MAKATFGNLLNGQGKPRWGTVEAFVVACARYANTRQPPLRLPPEALDLNRWRARYDAAYSSIAAPPPDAAFVAARRDYEARLQRRYRRVDVELLIPLTEQEEYPLREVFVAQAARVGPPPVELPEEPLRRRADASELGRGHLPDGVDPDMLAGSWREDQERPVRPVLQVLTEPGQQRLVLLGDPGAGKSTLARYLVLALAGGTVRPLAALAGWLPLLVELRPYAEPRWRDRTFLDLIDHLYTTEGLGLPKHMLDTFLRQDGRAVVIFDGLDEVFDPQLRGRVTHQIAGFAARYPTVRIMVTSRVIGYQPGILDAAGFARVMLQDLDREQIEKFVTRWYQIACPDNPPEAARLGERLLAAVGDSAAVRELAGNPMLLTVLSIIGRRRELPRDRRKVYEYAVEVLVEHWDPSKHLHITRADQNRPCLDHGDKLELLRRIARRMQEGPAGLAGNHIARPDLIAEFDTYLRERYELPRDRVKFAAKAMLEQFPERNFILSRFGAWVYGFVHRALLEYLVAADIVDRFNARDLTEDQLITEVFGRRWSDPVWQKVLLLITGMIKVRFAGQVIDQLLTLFAEDPLWFQRPGELPVYALLAVRCMGEVRMLGALTTQSHAIIETVISLLETAEAHSDRFDLTQAIEQSVLPVFISLGSHQAGRDRYQNWYLERDQLLATSPSVPQKVVSLATRIGAALLADSREFHELLQKQATQHPHWEVRQAAVQAVAEEWREDRGTLLLLRERATTDKHGYVRRAAVQALAAGWREDPGTLPLLRERATTDRHEYVRKAAAQALAAGWGEDTGTVALLQERACNDPDGAVRRAAVQALAARLRKDNGMEAFLWDRACTDPDEDVRRAAVQAVLVWREDADTAP